MVERPTTSRQGSLTSLLNFSFVGHHPEHLEHVAKRWATRGEEGRLQLVCPRVALDFNPTLALAARGGLGPSVDHHEVPPLTHPWARWKVLREYLEAKEPDQLVFMDFDSHLISLALRRPRGRTRLAGVYLRPTFHYGRWHEKPLRLRMRDRVKETVLRRAIRGAGFNALFCIDPYAVDYLSTRLSEVTVRWIPDPAPAPASTGPGLLKRLRSEPPKVSIVGALSPRKGITELMRAGARLTEAEKARLEIVVAGRAEDGFHARLRSAVQLGRASGLSVRLEEGYLQEDGLQALIEDSAVVAMLYVGHLGGSGILMRAAAAGVPVLGPSEGVLGHWIRDHGLGIGVDPRNPEAVARCLRSLLWQEDGFVFDPEHARAFASRHTPQEFADILIETLSG